MWLGIWRGLGSKTRHGFGTSKLTSVSGVSYCVACSQSGTPRGVAPSFRSIGRRCGITPAFVSRTPFRFSSPPSLCRFIGNSCEVLSLAGDLRLRVVLRDGPKLFPSDAVPGFILCITHSSRAEQRFWINWTQGKHLYLNKCQLATWTHGKARSSGTDLTQAVVSVRHGYCKAINRLPEASLGPSVAHGISCLRLPGGESQRLILSLGCAMVSYCRMDLPTKYSLTSIQSVYRHMPRWIIDSG